MSWQTGHPFDTITGGIFISMVEIPPLSLGEWLLSVHPDRQFEVVSLAFLSAVTFLLKRFERFRAAVYLYTFLSSAKLLIHIAIINSWAVHL